MTGPDTYDAVVIGAGPNGLVAANLLADAGWSVIVLEAEDAPGGAVRTAEVTAPGFRNDLFSAFYPLAAASPVMRSLDLERHGLRWVHAPAVVAHPTPGGPTAVLHRSVEATAATLDAFAPGDGEAWLRFMSRWERVLTPFVEALLSPFPPVRAGTKLVWRVGRRDLLPFARFSLLPLRRLVEEEGMHGDGARLLLAGNALHADLLPELPLSGMFGWLLCGLGHQVGFPAPAGGAERLIDALMARLGAAGGRVQCRSPVERVLVEGGRAAGVVVAGSDGTPVRARRAVLADCDGPTLLLRMVGREHLPAAAVAHLERFHRGDATVKLDWALSRPIPWRDPVVGTAGTVHLADDLDELSITTAHLARRMVPERLFVVLGQMTTTDPSRSPPGTESAWAYTHVPRQIVGDAGGSITGRWDDQDTRLVVERVEARIEAHAPGFRDCIVARHVFTPPSFERANRNLVDGDVNGGTAQLHQQLVFRPTVGLARAETPVPGLYLASASAHPGGGVHGACGANAARAALAHARLPRRRRRR